MVELPASNWALGWSDPASTAEEPSLYSFKHGGRESRALAVGVVISYLLPKPPICPIAGRKTRHGAETSPHAPLSLAELNPMGAQEPKVRRLPAGGRWIRTFRTAAREPRISEASQHRGQL
jgi:hypothetical protein